MLDIALVIAIATLVILVGGLVFGAFQLISIGKTRNAELLSSLSTLWESDMLKKGREKVREVEASGRNFRQQLEQAKSPDFIELIKVANFFETLGALVRLKVLKRDFANELFADAVWSYYKLYDEYIKAHRGEYPSLYTNFEDLMKGTLKS